MRAFRIIQADPDGLSKCGLMLLISIVPLVGGFVVLGWVTYALRRAHANVAPVFLPAPGDLGTAIDYGTQGLKAFFVSLCWTLPIVVFTMAFVGCLWFGAGATIVAGATQGEEMGAASMVIALLVVFGGGLTLAVFNILVSIPAAVATLRAELSGVLAEGFSISAVFTTVRAKFLPWVLNLLLMGLVQFGIAFLMLVPIVGIFLVGFVSQLVRGFAMLSVYEHVLVSTGTEAFPVGPLAPPSLSHLGQRA